MKKLLFVSLMLFVVSAAVADDLFPPIWRGWDQTLHAEWGIWQDLEGQDLTTSGGNAFPDVTNYHDLVPNDPRFNPFAPVGAILAAGTELLDEYFGRTKVIATNFDDDLTFGLPNFIGGEEKTMRIQITWLAHLSCPYTILFDISAYGEGGQILDGWDDVMSGGQNAGVHYAPIPGEDDLVWCTQAADILIEPNPYYETVGIKFRFEGEEIGGYIDQVVIDTICGEVPEPMTVCLLGLGGLFLRRKRRA